MRAARSPCVGPTDNAKGCHLIKEDHAEDWMAEFKADKTQQAKHQSVESYANWKQGVADGRVRIFMGAARISSGGK